MNDRGKVTNFRFPDEVLQAIDVLMERWSSKTQKDAVSRAILEAAEDAPKAVDVPPSAPQSDGLLQKIFERQLEVQVICEEILETVQTVQPEPEDPRQAFSPASIPGVNMGAGNLKPRRESSFEQASREEREKEQRSRARSNVGDDPTYTFDPEFVQE